MAKIHGIHDKAPARNAKKPSGKFKPSLLMGNSTRHTLSGDANLHAVKDKVIQKPARRYRVIKKPGIHTIASLGTLSDAENVRGKVSGATQFELDIRRRSGHKRLGKFQKFAGGRVLGA